MPNLVIYFVTFKTTRFYQLYLKLFIFSDNIYIPFILKGILKTRVQSGCSRGVMVKAMDCGIVENEFLFQFCYYVHFRENNLGKGMNHLILPAMG